MDMSSYRLSFINSLGLPSPPPLRVRAGTHEDARIAQGQRVQRVYLMLLTKAGVNFVMLRQGQITMGDSKVDMDLVAQLWNDAQLLVQCGRDLH